MQVYIITKITTLSCTHTVCLVQTLCVLYKHCVSWSDTVCPVHTPCILYTHCVSCTDTVCPVHTLCVLYRHCVSCTHTVCPVHTLCVLYTHCVSCTDTVCPEQTLCVLYTHNILIKVHERLSICWKLRVVVKHKITCFHTGYYASPHSANLVCRYQKTYLYTARHKWTRSHFLRSWHGKVSIKYPVFMYYMSVNKRYFIYRCVFSSFVTQNFGGDYTLITWHPP